MWKEWFRMGHMIDYFEFRKTKDLKEDKNTIYGEVSEWGEYESDARDYHGNLKFKTDTVFDNREKAKEYLERYEGKYEDVAVIYKEFEEKNTDISLTLVSVPSFNQVLEKAKDLLVIGKAPNIIYNGNSDSGTVYKFMVEKGYALNLMPYIENDSELKENIFGAGSL